MNKIVKIGVAGLAIAILFWGIGQLPINEWISAFEGVLKGLGVMAPILYFCVYIISCIALLPGSALTLLAGAIWGVVKGTILVSVSSVAGATVACLIGRYFAREKVEKQMEKFPKFKAVADSLGEGGLKLVTLVRLSPAFPFNLLNYMMGVTRVKLKDYVLGSWIGMFPGTVMYVYLGAASKEVLAAQGSGGKTPQEWALLVVGLAATIAVTVVITRKAKATLKTLENNENSD